MSLPASKLPRLVVLAAVAAGIDLADLFCYSITPTQVALTLSGTGETVWVDREGLETSRKYGPAPDDTRAQPAPGGAATGRLPAPQGGVIPGPCDPPEGGNE